MAMTDDNILLIQPASLNAKRQALDLLAQHADAMTVIEVDVGFESSHPDGEIIATRLFTPGPFSIAAGIYVPFGLEMLGEACYLLPRRLSEGKIATLIDDRRFAEAVYKIALADGVMDRVRYQDPAANV